MLPSRPWIDTRSHDDDGDDVFEENLKAGVLLRYLDHFFVRMVAQGTVRRVHLFAFLESYQQRDPTDRL